MIVADRFPSHIRAAWLGHSEKIADDFYRQVTDEHFAKAAQNPAQKAHEAGGKHWKAKTAGRSQAAADSGDGVNFPILSGYFTERKVGGAGFEPA